MLRRGKYDELPCKKKGPKAKSYRFYGSKVGQDIFNDNNLGIMVFILIFNQHKKKQINGSSFMEYMFSPGFYTMWSDYVLLLNLERSVREQYLKIT